MQVSLQPYAYLPTRLRAKCIRIRLRYQKCEDALRRCVCKEPIESLHLPLLSRYVRNMSMSDCDLAPVIRILKESSTHSNAVRTVSHICIAHPQHTLKPFHSPTLRTGNFPNTSPVETQPKRVVLIARAEVVTSPPS